MKISLIVTTCDNLCVFRRLLDSIKYSNFKLHQLIVIDQSENLETKDLVEKYKDYINIIYIYIGKRISLSKARNIGIKYSSGDILGFPDDDCWYEEDFFCNISNIFENNNYDMILTSVFDPLRNKIYGNKQSSKEIEVIKKNNIIKYSTSVGIFIRVNNEFEKFDEQLGVGAKWFGGEDIDYVARYIWKNKKVVFINSLKVYHEVDLNRDNEKEYRYSVGFGAVSKKMIYNYNMKNFKKDIFWRQTKSFIGMCIFKFLNHKKYKKYISKFKGVKDGLKYR